MTQASTKTATSPSDAVDTSTESNIADCNIVDKSNVPEPAAHVMPTDNPESVQIALFGASGASKIVFAVYNSLTNPTVTPRSYKQAVNGPDAAKWWDTILAKEANFIKKGTYCIEKLPPGYNWKDVLGGT
jgi:hypothetical protein